MITRASGEIPFTGLIRFEAEKTSDGVEVVRVTLAPMNYKERMYVQRAAERDIERVELERKEAL